MITKVHLQTFSVFALPEMLKQRRRLFSSATWSEYLQEEFLNKHYVTQKEFKLRPVYDPNKDRRGEGDYTDFFWRSFQGPAARSLPLHIPFRLQFERPELRPEWEEVQPQEYAIRLRGRIYPYGAVSLRLSEYLCPINPITTEQLIAVFKGKFENGKSRGGYLGDLKNRIMNAFVSQDHELTHPEGTYRLLHFESDTTMSYSRDRKAFLPLLTFSSRREKVNRYAKKMFANLSDKAKKGQVILLGQDGGVAYTKSLADSIKPFGRKCLRNHLSNIIELVLIQRQYYESYRPGIVQLGATMPFDRLSTLQAIRDCVAPTIRFKELRTLYSILQLEKLMDNAHVPPALRWRKWTDTLSHEIFPDRSIALELLQHFGELDEALKSESLSAAKSALGFIAVILGKIK